MGRFGWEPSVYTEKAGGEVPGEGQGADLERRTRLDSSYPTV